MREALLEGDAAVATVQADAARAAEGAAADVRVLRADFDGCRDLGGGCTS